MINLSQTAFCGILSKCHEVLLFPLYHQNIKQFSALKIISLDESALYHIRNYVIQSNYMERDIKRLGTHNPLQRHTADDLTTVHQALPPVGSSTSQ